MGGWGQGGRGAGRMGARGHGATWRLGPCCARPLSPLRAERSEVNAAVAGPQGSHWLPPTPTPTPDPDLHPEPKPHSNSQVPRGSHRRSPQRSQAAGRWYTSPLLAAARPWRQHPPENLSLWTPANGWHSPWHAPLAQQRQPPTCAVLYSPPAGPRSTTTAVGMAPPLPSPSRHGCSRWKPSVLMVAAATAVAAMAAAAVERAAHSRTRSGSASSRRTLRAGVPTLAAAQTVEVAEVAVVAEAAVAAEAS